MVIFWVSGVFWSFFGFQEYFGHFLGFCGILVIFRFWGYFDHFLGFEGILVIFWVLGYFDNFKFGSILVIFEDFRVLWSFSL